VAVLIPIHWRAVEFEKWQALGNDYVILEAVELPWALTPARVRRLCDPHLGVGADGVLLLSDAQQPGFVARLRIFNPDGSEAELSGNGAREAIVYLRRNGWTDAPTFSIQTAAGEIRPTVLDERTCRVDMGRARLGIDGEVEGWRFQQVFVGNPQCTIEVPEPDALDLERYGPEIERNPAFPNRTNVSFWRPLEDGIRARIFERGVGETLSSGTGACGAAVAAHLAGAPNELIIELDGGELEVAIGDDLEVSLTGWAEPVYSGELSAEALRTLEALE